jgi:nicotinamidase-related amidase
MKKSALLIIDLQKDFTQSSGRLPVDLIHAEQMIANIKRDCCLYRHRNPFAHLHWQRIWQA